MSECQGHGRNCDCPYCSGQYSETKKMEANGMPKSPMDTLEEVADGEPRLTCAACGVVTDSLRPFCGECANKM